MRWVDVEHSSDPVDWLIYLADCQAATLSWLNNIAGYVGETKRNRDLCQKHLEAMERFCPGVKSASVKARLNREINKANEKLNRKA